MVIRDEVVDLRGKTSSHDERVRRRETLVGAKVSGVLRDLKVNRQTDQVWMRPEKPKHRLMARRDGSHRPDQDFHDRHHRDDAGISSRADKDLEDERSDGMRRVVRVEECRKHRGVEEQTIAFRDLLEQRRLRHRLFAPGCPLAADVLEVSSAVPKTPVRLPAKSRGITRTRATPGSVGSVSKIRMSSGAASRARTIGSGMVSWFFGRRRASASIARVSSSILSSPEYDLTVRRRTPMVNVGV